MPIKVLILDDDSRFAEGVAGHCRASGLYAETAPDLITAARLAARQPPDLVCLDVDVQTGGGLDICEKLSRDPHLGGRPMVLLAGHQAKRVRAYGELRGYYVHNSVTCWTTLRAVIEELLEYSAQDLGSAADPRSTQSSLPAGGRSPA